MHQIYGNIESLENAIIESATKYYTTGTSNLSDAEFDYLVSMLKAMDPTNPILNSTGWGYKVNSHDKCKHINGKITGIPDKLPPYKALKIKGSHFIITPKLDGLSVISYYENGRYVGSLTRGDGEFGENITFHVRDKVPAKLMTANNQPITGMIRGEFIIKNSLWKTKYSNEFKSARNFGAGILNRKEVTTFVKDFDIVHYSLFDCYRTHTYEEQLKLLQLNNVVTVKSISENDLSAYTNPAYCKEILSRLNNNEYECDGLVVMALQSDNNYQRYAIKWNNEGIETTVRDIIWEQSRLGKFNPVVVIEPVEIAGATIKRASGFNYQYVMNNKLGIGSRIKIVRSGEVIPYITEVLTQSDQNNCPVTCPCCGSKLDINGVDLICTNKNCISVSRANTLYFINTVNPIDGLGDNILNMVFNHFGISTITDLVKTCVAYNANKSTVQYELLRFSHNTKGLGQAAFKRVCELYETMLTQPHPLATIVGGLGLNGVGLKNAEKIFANIHNNQELNSFFENQLETLNLPGVSYIAIDSIKENADYIKDILSYFNNIEYSDNIEELPENMLKYNIGISITGGLSCSRRQFLERCARHGIYEVPIAKAELLITNEPNSGSSKNKTAIKKGIRIISEKEFIEEYFNNALH